MKIINFKAENFKRLIAVEITPDGNVVKITGKNGAGKTSILDAILCALGGTKNAPSLPIRKGADKATVTLDLGDFIVTRTWKGDASVLKITNPDNSVKQKPQDVLNSLLGRFTFDPMSFMEAKPAERRETLLGMIDIKLPKEWTELGEAMPESDPLGYIATRRKEIFAQRTDTGRELDRTNGALSTARAALPAGDSPARVSVAELTATLQSANEQNAMNAASVDKINRGNAKCAELEQQIGEVERQILVLTAKKAELAAERLRIETIVSGITVCEKIDTAAIVAKISEAENANRAADQYDAKLAEVKRLADDESKLSAVYNALSDKIKKIDAIKETALAGAALPVIGLGVADGDVTFNGIPFEQCSHAERLKISMSIGMALNPKIHVMRVTDGEKFDSDSWKIIQELADANDFQVWIEKMDESGEVGIFIEDGMFGVAAEENKQIDKELELS